ncbi:MAG: CehA/McbA family metallohydrolase [Gammaproteobacteria bacterium]|nr:CehA/McbA family metallohydrolase [Gammaproteobacteria bacterium]
MLEARSTLTVYRACVLCAAAALSACGGSAPGVTVQTGPTTIPGGDALGALDITVTTDRLAVAFAVETAPPWGVARGGIVDVAIVKDGKVSGDLASLADFLPDGWSGWPTSYQVVAIESQTGDEVVVRTERDWGDVRLVTRFRIRAGDDRIRMQTEMTNAGDTPLAGLSSGYVLWPDGGFIFGIPGLGGLFDGATDDRLANWSAFYDEDWLLGLHADFDDHFSSDGRDRFLLHDLAVGETRSFEAWLEVGERGELAPLVASGIDIDGLPSGRVTGTVNDVDGKIVDGAVVVAERTGNTGSRPYAWAAADGGRYSFALPEGTYRLYATARGYAKSTVAPVEIDEGQVVASDFTDLRPPGELAIRVIDEASGAPLDARITIEEGATPLVGYFGKAVYFTELGATGTAALTLAPGDYRLRVSRAEGFTAAPIFLDIAVTSAESREVTAVVEVVADPAARGWYGADLHHHSDVLDGYTEPHFVMRSELAAGLDITFLSDHDSVENNVAMSRLAAERNIPFIPGTELSPSWAHFNAYPLEPGETISIDVGASTAEAIFAEARRMGADVVAVNHPYIDYGYFRSRDSGTIPGGYSSAFDLVEISASEPNEQTIPAVWALWNQGQRAYLTAGSDAHDVWQEVSGAARMYVYVEGELTIDKFIAALRSGHSYASAGPLVYPETIFGEELAVTAGESLELAYSVQAVSGLARVALIERGVEVGSKSFGGETVEVPVSFRVRLDDDSWFALVVEDANGKAAYTNPVWVVVTE